MSATLAAVDDAVYEGDETVEVSASHGGVAIGASHTVTITDEGDRAQVTRMLNTSPVLDDNVVDLWPGEVLVMFDREVDGLEAHEVEVTNALVTSVVHQGTGAGAEHLPGGVRGHGRGRGADDGARAGERRGRRQRALGGGGRLLGGHQGDGRGPRR